MENKVLDKIVELVADFVKDNNTLPWKSPYFFQTFNSFVNPLRKKDFDGKDAPLGVPYRGFINSMILMLVSCATAKRLGLKTMDNRFVPASCIFNKEYKIHKEATVVKGAKLATIFFPIIKKNDGFDASKPSGPKNKESKFLGFSTGNVVNVADTNLVELGLLPPVSQPESRDNPQIQQIETLLRAYPQDFGNEDCIPHYSLTQKHIRMPAIENFLDSPSYYGTWIHELSHQIGDMVKGLTGGMNKQSYSEEELNAELTKVYVMAELGFANAGEDSETNSVVYVATWLKRIKDNPEILFEAARIATARGKMILGTKLPEVIREREQFHFLPRE